MVTHPLEQPPARADDDVRERERGSLGNLLAEALEGVGNLLRKRRQHPARAVAVHDEGRLRQRTSCLAGSQRRVPEAAPVVDDHDVGRVLAQDLEDLERCREIGRPDAGVVLDDADVDTRGLVAARPLRTEWSDVPSARDEELDLMPMAAECNGKQRVGCSRAAGAGSA